MKKRWVIFIISLVGWTFMAYWLLAFLELEQIGPIRIVANRSRPEFVHHGMPRFSLIGSLAWLAVLGLYSIGSVVAARDLFGPLRKRNLLLASSLLVILSSTFVAVIHPTFLLTILPEGGRGALTDFAGAYAPLLDEIYFHWGLPRLKYLVVLLQTLITLTVITPFVLRNGTTRSS